MTLIKIYTEKGLVQEIRTADEVTAIKTNIAIPIINSFDSSSYLEKKKIRQAIEEFVKANQGQLRKNEDIKKILFWKLGLSEGKE